MGNRPGRPRNKYNSDFYVKDYEREMINNLPTLQKACRLGDLKTVKDNIGELQNLSENDKFQCASDACKYGYLNILQLLVPHINVNYFLEKTDYTVLMTASFFNHSKIVKILLDAGADLFTKKSNNNDALISAVKSSSINIVKLFLEQYKIKNYDLNYVAFLKASEIGNSTIIRLFLEYGYNVDELVKKYPDSDYVSFSLLEAVKTNNIEIVRLLIDSGAKPNLNDYNALVSATLNRYNKLVALLLPYCKNINWQDANGNTFLMNMSGYSSDSESFRAKTLYLIRLYKNYGADLSIRNNKGQNLVDVMKDHWSDYGEIKYLVENCCEN